MEWAKENYGDEGMMRLLHAFFRISGSRYAAQDVEACRKTRGALANYQALKKMGGPLAFYHHLKALVDPWHRVEFLQENFHYMGPESARDMINHLYLDSPLLAIDARLTNFCEDEFGWSIPKEDLNQEEIYRKWEQKILREICEPLGISGFFLDQLIFNFYE